jgi:hypothetical protein
MSELESLFLIVLVIYLVQCIYWVAPGAAVFALSLRGRGKRKQRGFVWQALKTEGFLAWPLPPLTPLAVAVWPAFELNPDGVAFRSGDGEWTTVPWDRLTMTRSESRLRSNGAVILHAGETQVFNTSVVLERLRSAEKTSRCAMIQRWLGKAMRDLTASRRVRLFAGRSRFLRILAQVQLVFLFVAAPLAFAWLGPRVLWRVALFLLAMQALIALEFWTAHKQLFRHATSARFKSTLTILLSPLAAIRGCDLLARDLFSGCHPLAVAGAVLPTADFAHFAGEELRQWRFGDHPDVWYQETMAKLLNQAIRRAGTRPETLLRPAERESGCVVYCPRCLSQYVKDAGGCTDCGFGNLVPFGGRAAPQNPTQRQ